MDETDLSPLLGQLETNLEDLEAALEPLLRNNLSEIAAKLPLLDKAKLHVLVTYAIESILFCAVSFSVWSGTKSLLILHHSLPTIEWYQRKGASGLS